MKLTNKQEKFCLAYISAKNASDAYRASYDAEKMKDASVNRKAFELLQNVKITARIDSLRAESAKAAVLTVNDLIEELEQARVLAVNDGQASAAVAATMGKAKLLGFGSEKIDSKNTTELVIVGGLPDPFVEIVDATDHAQDPA